MDAGKGFFDLVVRKVVERVEVAADCAGEENGVLGDNGKAST